MGWAAIRGFWVFFFHSGVQKELPPRGTKPSDIEAKRFTIVAFVSPPCPLVVQGVFAL